jgi:hypothetical protein
MQSVTILLPDELLDAIAVPGEDLSRTILEGLATDAYRRRRLSSVQLRRLLGYETRMELDASLKSHDVELEYTSEDLERDRATHLQRPLHS